MGKETQNQKDSGIGVGYRPDFRDTFLNGPRPSVSWIEVISENHFRTREGEDTRALQTLRRLRRDFPVALHGVGLNLASADPLDERYLKELSFLVGVAQPWLVTDHLCWTGRGRENLFDLMPFPFTLSALDLVAGKIQRVQDALKRQIAVENLTFYTHPRGDEMREEEFLNQLCARTGCRQLLDINNIYVNSRNFGLDPMEYLRRIDLRNVAQVHLAGHSRDSSGLLIDTHGARVIDEVWSLFEAALQLMGPVPTMIERDQNIPEWSEMETELERLRQLRAPFLKEERHESSRMADARS
jgi:uncharacterized protein (UPF0276 family)